MRIFQTEQERWNYVRRWATMYSGESGSRAEIEAGTLMHWWIDCWWDDVCRERKVDWQARMDEVKRLTEILLSFYGVIAVITEDAEG
jgi:hypothetical protein